MFILRRLTSENAEMNTVLGERYHLVLKERNSDEHKRALRAMKWEKAYDEDLYGFVIYNSANAMVHYPLYTNSLYFVMTSDGQTFANITFK